MWKFEKNPLMVSMMPPTVFFAVSMGLVMASLTLLKMPSTVPTKLLKVLVMLFQIPLTTPPMFELMAFQMLLATLNTLFQMEAHTL